MKIVDKRLQKQRIIIEFEKTGYDFDLSQKVDGIVNDLKIILEQRNLDNIKSIITLE